MLRPTKYIKLIISVSILLVLSGCSVMRSYNDELTQTINLAGNNQIDGALQSHEKNNDMGDKDLLYYLEKGQLLRFKNQYQESLDTWMLADNKIKEWEEEATIRLGAAAEYLGTVLLNDKTRRYDGHDYEKVMLTTQLALDHLLGNDFDNARIEIKKMHEREAIIAKIIAQDKEELEKESEEKGVKTTFKELDGYPVEMLDDPEVTNLKNGYQSAFSHYLAGFVYEALNEEGLAAPGYRQAIELQPNINILEKGLAGLDKRDSQRKSAETDVLFVIESGTAPSLNSIMIPIPILVGNTGIVPISFPILKIDPTKTITPVKLEIEGQNPVMLSTVTSLNTLSKRALRDDMPGIILRGVLRAAAKTMSQKAVRDVGGVGGLIGGTVLNVINVITESADERTWRTLPADISIGRMMLPAGDNEITIKTSNGTKNKHTINIQGSHAVVVVRLIGNQVYWSQPNYDDVSDDEFEFDTVKN